MSADAEENGSGPPPALDTLPDEIILRIARFLRAPDVLRLSTASKVFRFVSFENVIWRSLYRTGFPTSYAIHAPRHTGPDEDWVELTKQAADVEKRFRTGRPHIAGSLPGPRDRPSGHSGRVFGVAMFQSSPGLAPHAFSAGDDGALKLWNLETMECASTFTPSTDGEGGLFDVKKDAVYGEHRFLTSTFSGKAQILDVFEPGTVSLDGLKAAELKEMLTKRGISSAGCFGW
jgi:WD40 repeat protein